MIRTLQDTDISQVADIWLDTNLKAHDFIPAQYWKDHFEPVKKMLLQAEVYVYEEESTHNIDGFLGLDADYIAGIFVRSGVQSKGIGRLLLDFAKSVKGHLTLSVYQKNERAVKFYLREAFYIQQERLDKSTDEKEYLMVWNP